MPYIMIDGQTPDSYYYVFNSFSPSPGSDAVAVLYNKYGSTSGEIMHSFGLVKDKYGQSLDSYRSITKRKLMQVTDDNIFYFNGKFWTWIEPATFKTIDTYYKLDEVDIDEYLELQGYTEIKDATLQPNDIFRTSNNSLAKAVQILDISTNNVTVDCQLIRSAYGRLFIPYKETRTALLSTANMRIYREEVDNGGVEL